MNVRRLSLMALAAVLAGCHAVPTRSGLDAVPSPDGRAALVTLGRTEASVEGVVLVAAGDTTRVLGPTDVPHVSSEWLGPDLGRVWLPVGGNYHHASVFVQPSSRRHSPVLDDDLAVDASAGTVATRDARALTLRDLWTGRSLATWSPPGLDLVQLYQECDPKAALAGRALTLRYDCGDGPHALDVPW